MKFAAIYPKLNVVNFMTGTLFYAPSATAGQKNADFIIDWVQVALIYLSLKKKYVLIIKVCYK